MIEDRQPMKTHKVSAEPASGCHYGGVRDVVSLT